MIEWIVAHKADIGAIITSVFSLVWLIAKLTPTKKDDEIIGKIQSILSTNKK